MIVQLVCLSYSTTICFVDWECQIDKFYIHSEHLRPNKDSRFKLLVGFFKFYATLGFQKFVLCPLTASLIPRQKFDQLELPSHFDSYVKYVSTSFALILLMILKSPSSRPNNYFIYSSTDCNLV